PRDLLYLPSFPTRRSSDLVNRFGSQFAAQIRRGRPAPTDKWHLDEVVIRIKGRTHWLWRAVDANGDVLDILLQSRRNKVAAQRLDRKSTRLNSSHVKISYA